MSKQKKEGLVLMESVSTRFKDTPIAKALVNNGKETFVDKVLANFYFVCKKNEDKLEKLDLHSVLEALTKCCQYELIPDGINACLIPRWIKDEKKWEFNFQPMYQGLLETLYKTGFVKSVSAEVVYDVDEFDFNQGSDPFIKHKVNLTAKRERKLGAYVNIELMNGGRVIRVMTKTDIDRIRARAQTDKVWSKDYDEMAVKTVLKRGYKQCPKSEKLSDLINYDNSLEYDFEEDKESKSNTKIEGIKNILAIPEPENKIVAEIPKAEKTEVRTEEEIEKEMEEMQNEYI